MPLTDYQKKLARLLALNRTEDSHLAGGAALHFTPQSIRYSNDLDYFHDSVERVATAFTADEAELKRSGYTIELEIKQPGYIRARVFNATGATKIEWSHDTAWRFLPTIHNADLGYVLHPVDLAINKILALAGRNEPRDFLDAIHVHQTILPLGALCWAAAGKDPGFSPNSLLELLRRRGRFQQNDFDRLKLVAPVHLNELKSNWLEILETAKLFIESRPADEVGCLYYSAQTQAFYAPTQNDTTCQIHFGQPGGILPKIENDS